MGEVLAQLVAGSEVFDMALISDREGLSPIMGGVSEVNFKAHQYMQPTTLEDMLYTERWQVIVKDDSGPDGLRRRISRLIDILRQAWGYHEEDYFTTPIYMRFQSACESNVRTALVHSSPDISGPWPAWDPSLEQARAINNLGVSISRFVWRAGTPGTLPSKTVLEAPQGEVAPTMVHVANYQDDHLLSDIYVEDNSLGTYSANLFGTAAHAYFPAVPAANDAIYFGSDEPFWSIVGNVGTAGDFVWTLVAEYWSGAAWTALTLGTEYTMWPYSLEDTFRRTGHFEFNWWKAASGWAKTAVNGQNKFWIRFRISAFTSTATSPANATTAVYNLHQSYFDIPQAAMKGDGPPYAMLRISHPFGSTAATPALGTTSRIIVGSKSRGLAGFTAFLNAGGDGNPAAWVVTYGTDAATATDVQSPSGDKAAISFATSATLQYRVRWTGTDVLPYYVGKYRVFLRCKQVGGAAGDCRARMRFRINGATDTDPVWESFTVATASHDAVEILDMTPGGYIKFPFGDVVDADVLTLADLIIEAHVERSTGVSTFEIFDLILMPCDEWIADLDDPLTDTTTGASALRSLSLLDVDSGIIWDRTAKHVLGFTAATVTPPIYFAEGWNRRGAPMRLAKDRTNRLFFLNLRYDANYSTAQLTGLTGRGLACELYLQPIYYYLRGDD
jgi:hypothetical protein